MSKQKQRIDITQDSVPLTSNPFEGLRALVSDHLREQGETKAPPPKAVIVRAEKHPFKIQRARKGGYHIAFEHRAKGKGVTVLRGVVGDAEALLRELKQRCGAGGTVQDDAIELQGNHQKAIEHFLIGEGL